MGLCQGRNCQRTIAALIAPGTAARSASRRLGDAALPARPVPLAAIADDSIEDHGFFTIAAAATRPDAAASRWLPLSGDQRAAARRDRRPRRRRRLIGCALAYYLAASGVAAMLLERGELNREASGTNAGSFHLQIAIHQLTGLEVDSRRRSPAPRDPRSTSRRRRSGTGSSPSSTARSRCTSPAA